MRALWPLVSLRAAVGHFAVQVSGQRDCRHHSFDQHCGRVTRVDLIRGALWGL